MGLFFARMEVEQTRLTEQRVSTIAELERVNRRLADALAENERLHDELLRGAASRAGTRSASGWRWRSTTRSRRA